MLTGKLYHITKDAFLKGPRLIAQKGGTRSGKTYSIVQMLVTLANVGRKRQIDIVSESLPHLKRGAIKDLDEILEAAGQTEGNEYTLNKSDHEYTFKATGTVIRCFSADNWGKVKGSRRDILFINEANRIDWETYRQLAVRTTETIIIDWNPDSEFWYEGNKLNLEPSTIEIHSTYKDNDFITALQIAEIESNRERDPNWWRIYGEGETGIPTGLIYTNHHLIDVIPDRVRRHAMHTRGLDFGFTNDPTALVDVYIDKNAKAIYCNELIYRKGMLNVDIVNEMKAQGINPKIEIFADAAEPKSIAEIHGYGFNVKPSYKKDLNTQIQWLQGYDLYITKSSLEGIKEFRNYKWKIDKDGKPVNEPVDLWNHCFVGDTPILTESGYKPIKDIKIGDVVLTSNGFCRVKNKFNNGKHNTMKFLLYLQGNQIISLTCTPNHKIKTIKGWKEISRLKYGDCLYLAKSSTGRDFIFTTGKDITRKEEGDFIGSYGNISTEKSPKDTTSTTRTRTAQTTGLKTLSLSNARSIFPSIQRAFQWTRRSQEWIMRGHTPTNGTGARKAGLGTSSMESKSQSTSNSRISPASYAEKDSRARKRAQNSAATTANPNTGGCKGLTTSREHAPIAGKSSSQTNSAKHNAVQIAALLNIDGRNAGKRTVYDLEIEDFHEYIANGIVVHNCMDALRYATYTPIMGRPAYTGGTIKMHKLK